MLRKFCDIDFGDNGGDGGGGRGRRKIGAKFLRKISFTRLKSDIVKNTER